ncbi:RHS repeat-associated core domain-containing protein [Kitasatospora purpeofusca]|uniref:RHS repeat-associated core domain-containing protein n=1 Tax=Kitasatospora purpeofusca TaxID=67352 RepID=UPI003661AC02
MPSVSSFFTQATNFGSSVSGGVDPRTGLYNVRIVLGRLVGNRNLGPSLPLALGYSPLDGTDLGFGRGFSPGLTTYDTDNALLALSTGERYKVVETGTEVLPQQKKLDTVRIGKDEDGDFYRIVHKSGEVEILTGPQNAFGLKVPTALLTPAGHRLTLSWDFGEAQPRLLAVADESDTLLTVDLDDAARHVLRVLPGHSEGYDVELLFQNEQLSTVRHLGLGPGEPLEWSFRYEPMGEQGEWGSWLTGVVLPGGMSETASYTADGHRFPDSCDLPPLPRVVRFAQEPGGGQPTVAADYDYTSTNFVGGFSGASYDAGSDTLYGVLTGYTYGSTESRTCGADTRTITRTYNSYHLLTEETTAQNGCSQQVGTEYYARIGQEFDQQPAQFQLPTRRTVTWTDPARNTRSDITATDFDERGNPRSRTAPDGSRTDWTYYPAGGSGSDCPPDPHGFTRSLKEVVRTPPATGFDAPVLTTVYRYASYATGEPRVGAALVKVQEQQLADGRELSSVGFHYRTSGEEFGRLLGLDGTETLGGDAGHGFVTVAATHTFGFAVDGEALDQTHAVTTDDGLTLTRSERRSRFTGRLWSATDTQGNGVAVTYDGLGRMLTRTVNPGTAHQAVETRAYATGGDAPFLVTATSPMMSADPGEPGEQVRVALDGAGRPVRRERRAVDGDGGWYVVQRVGYDEQGRTASVTDTDHLPDGSAGGELTETFGYDDWGRVSATDSTDGSTRVGRSDPVALTTTTQLKGGGSPVTGTVVTTHNQRGEPVRVERFDLRGVSRGVRTLDRDGWGRVRRVTDELGNSTRHDYNPRGLPTLTELPDGTQVSRAHDVRQDGGGLATELTVGKAHYGTRTFDRLGRLTGTASGGRAWHYDYDRDSDLVPTGATTPDGQRRGYAVVPELDNVLTAVRADRVTQEFTPHPVTGFPTAAREGEVAVTRDYYPSGLPRAETVSRPGAPDTTVTWQFTLGGDEVACTGVDGAVRRTSRDRLGRLQEITDPDLRVLDPVHDPASRLTGWTVEDLGTGATLATALTLDDLGREVARGFTRTLGGGGAPEVWTQTQEWQDNDLLSARTLRRGAELLRRETFGYDSRNRLTDYSCQGPVPPQDELGRGITAQTFRHDGWSNLTDSRTEFADGGSETAGYHYDNPLDPCQLTGISRTGADGDIRLTYDAAGRLTTDEAGRALRYDALGRLAATEGAGGYGYDPFDRLLTRTAPDGGTGALSYRGETLASVTEDDRSARLLHLGDHPVAQHGPGGPPATRLLGADGTGTVRVSASGTESDQYAYTPYGLRPAQTGDGVLGFTGRAVDPLTGCYHLGNGARDYHPALRRFATPDPLSPFGAGGVNPYAYCAGDPVNRVDPSGHLSWTAWLGIGLGVAGLALTVVTGGLAVVAAGGVLAALGAASTATLVVGALGVASDVTAIVGGALEKASPKASSVLGWVSLGTGLAGLAEAGTALARTASRLGARAPEVAGDAAHGIGGGNVRALGDYPALVDAPDGGPMVVRVPEVMHGRYDAERYFTRTPNPRYRNAVWTSVYRATPEMVETTAREARGLPEVREIHILSGTHGTRTGERGPNEVSERILGEDQDLAATMNGEDPRVLVTAHNLPTMRHGSLRAVLERPNAEIIAAFCYSRNDRVLREILGLHPTVSFTKR